MEEETTMKLDQKWIDKVSREGDSGSCLVGEPLIKQRTEVQTKAETKRRRLRAAAIRQQNASKGKLG